MLKLKLLADFGTGLLARMLKGEFEVLETEGTGGYVKELMEPALGASDFTVLVLKDAAKTEIPEDVMVLKVPENFGHRSAKWDELAACPWDWEGLEAIAGRIRMMARLKKVLALDFDNTLWHGIVSEGDEVTENREVQELALEAKSKGILLVGLSKNDEEETDKVWGRMSVKKGDFAAMGVNWEAKAENLERIMAQLRLGMDSVVFIDDRATERAAMRSAHPEVLTFGVEDLGEARRVLAAHWRKDGGDRTEEYKAQFKRYGEFLADLKIETDIHGIRPEEYGRVAELSQRANRFNLSGRRFSADEVKAMAEDAGIVFKTLSTKDKYGDLGLVGYAVKKGGKVADLTISCRALDRRHEYELYAAMGKGELEFRDTGKNGAAKRFAEEVRQ